ncbi:MAG TPA: acyl-CoA dehydrogenase family protein [Ilumatobacteraceae bacterium]|nr:acyl-CoA dehydrogenase family protein [Ilumatobacteraceae bacterium]
MIEWSDEQRQMQAAVREFVQKEVVPRREELEHGDLAPYDVLRSYVRTFGIDEMARERFERESGGPPFTTEERYDRAVMTLLPMVEFCRHCPGLMTAMGVSMNLAGNAVKKGTPEQRERWALPLLTLEKIGAWAITEPDSGSDAFGGMRSSAVRDGDTFVLNGSKTFITNGPFADTTVFICKLDDGVTPARERRVLSFVLDRGMPGFEQSPPLRKMGLHSSPTGQLFLDDVEVGVDRLIGGAASLGDGATAERSGDEDGAATRRSREAARAAFASERASVAAMALGIIEQCVEVAVDYARTRVQFGRPIGDFQLIQNKLAMMEVARVNVQNMLFRYLETMRAGKSLSFAEASAIKLYAARAATEVALDAVQVLGGNGYMAEYHVEQLARDAKVLQIYAGTDELQTTAIAKDLLRR